MKAKKTTKEDFLIGELQTLFAGLQEDYWREVSERVFEDEYLSLRKEWKSLVKKCILAYWEQQREQIKQTSK